MTNDWQDLELDEIGGDEELGDVTRLTLNPGVEEKNLRLDKFIATNISDLSRGHVQRLIEDGLVTVDQVVRRQKFKVTRVR